MPREPEHPRLHLDRYPLDSALHVNPHIWVRVIRKSEATRLGHENHGGVLGAKQALSSGDRPHHDAGDDGQNEEYEEDTARFHGAPITHGLPRNR